MIDFTQQSGVTLVVLGQAYSSLDERSLDELGGVLLTTAATAEPPRLVLDMSATDYIGSAFIELLVRVWKRLTERGGAMTLCGVRPFCADVLHISRVDSLWETYPTSEEALTATAVGAR